MLKPVRLDRLHQTVERAERRRAVKAAAQQLSVTVTSTNLNDSIWVAATGGQVRVGVDQLVWVEAARDYVMLHTATSSYILKTSMNALEQGLHRNQIMRVYRSTFIRPTLVISVQRLGRGP